jgi:hypothetical protein
MTKGVFASDYFFAQNAAFFFSFSINRFLSMMTWLVVVR